MTDDATRSTPSDLPPEIEEQVYARFFATQEDDRERALAELVDRHPANAAAIRALQAKLQAGAGVFGEIGIDDEAGMPERIGDYKILDKLGEGGFGVVYLAEQSQPIRRRVAIKCLLPGMDSRTVLARFEAERQALALMNHSNIANVFDARGDDDGRPYFVMEYVPGVPITQYCDEQRLTNRERLALFSQVCDAVQHAHQKGVIHRDLKPSNVLVAEVDGQPAPKIIDFGVAKAIYQPLTMRTVFTAVGRMVGTPAYMSPEQTSPTPLDIDTRADIYSLGVMLYELLTGSLPFTSKELQGQGFEAIQRVVRESTPPRPSARVTSDATQSGELARRRSTSAAVLVDELRGDLDWIVLRAIEKERSRRYDTARELAADIGRHLEHVPVLARPPELSYVFRKFVRRNRTQVVAGIAVGLAVVVGLVFSTIFYLQAKENLEQANANLKQADDNLKLADENLARYDRIADLVLVDRCLREAEQLWPEREAMAKAMQAWLDAARPLAKRLPEHREARSEIEKRRSAVGPDGAPVFVDKRDQFLFRSLSELIVKLEGFAEPKIGLLQDVVDRLDRAKTAHQRSIGAHEAKWQACIAAVGKDERFRGFTLTPQIGLVPIGPDPKTGLQEFAHLRTGEPAARKDGKIVVSRETGLVFVLLPGGRFWMGSQAEDPEKPNFVMRRRLTKYEVPVHEVTLAPFFVSKFEMTQAQWARFTRDNPSRFRLDEPEEGRPPTHLHPIESVSRTRAGEVLARMSLQLPTEAQWEYACRAGTTTPWHTGKDVASMKGKTNICDEGSQAAYPESPTERGFSDGWPLHAPVGRFPPNDFGLHDMVGNVSEWTFDWFKGYENPTDPKDGRRLGPGHDRPYATSRGGNYTAVANYARSALRSAHNPDDGTHSVGIRPARRIE